MMKKILSIAASVFLFTQVAAHAVSTGTAVWWQSAQDSITGSNITTNTVAVIAGIKGEFNVYDSSDVTKRHTIVSISSQGIATAFGVTGTSLTVTGGSVTVNGQTYLWPSTATTGNCLKYNSGTLTWASCGGGASTLETFVNGVRISSPTATLKFGTAFSGSLPAANTAQIDLNPSSATLKGNSFNGANQLVQLNSSSGLPAIDGSLLTNVVSTSITSQVNSTYTALSNNLATLTTTYDISGSSPIIAGLQFSVPTVQFVDYSTAATSADAGSGSFSWSNLSSALATDGVSAQATGTTGLNSNYLEITNFGFNIPGSAQITGVQADIIKGKSVSFFSVFDHKVQLVVGGSFLGTDKSNLNANWPQALSDSFYGSSTDTWGNTLTPSTVNASNFGIVFQANFGGNLTAFVDAIHLKVTYINNSVVGSQDAWSMYSILTSSVPLNTVRLNNLDTSTVTLTTRLNNLDTSTASLTTRTGNLDVSTAALTVRLNNLDISTSALTTRLNNLDTSTTSITTAINSTAAAISKYEAGLNTTTGTFNVRLNNLDTSTAALTSAINAVSTATTQAKFNEIATDTSTLLLISSASTSYQLIASSSNFIWNSSTPNPNGSVLAVTSGTFSTKVTAGILEMNSANQSWNWTTGETISPLSRKLSLKDNTNNYDILAIDGVNKNVGLSGTNAVSWFGYGPSCLLDVWGGSVTIRGTGAALSVAGYDVTNRFGNLDAAILNLSSSTSAGGGGGVKSLYFRNSLDASLSNTYNVMFTTPSTASEGTQSASVASANGLVLVASFTTVVTGLGLDVNLIPAGFFQFTMFAQIDSFVGTTNLVIDVSTMSRTGTGISRVVSSTITNVNSTTYAPYISESVLASDVSISTDDRLLVKVYAQTTSALARTVTLITDGSARDSRIGTTIERNPTFISLNDAPSSYVGKSGQFPQVNGTETGLTFVAVTQAADFQNLPKSGATAYLQNVSTGQVYNLLNSSGGLSSLGIKTASPSSALDVVNGSVTIRGTGAALSVPWILVSTLSYLNSGAGVFGTRLSVSATEYAPSYSSYTAISTLYLDSGRGNFVTTMDKSSNTYVWAMVSTISISLSGLSANSQYRVYLASTGVLQWGPAFSASNVAADTVTLVNGILVLSTDITRVYLGTVWTTAAGQTEDSPEKRRVYNFWNQVQRPLQKNFTFGNYTYTGSTRALNGDAGNSVSAMMDVGYSLVNLQVSMSASADGTGFYNSGWGVDSTSAFFVPSGGSYELGTFSGRVPLNTPLLYYHSIGGHVFYPVESSDNGGSLTVFGPGGPKRPGILGTVIQ